MRLTDRHSARWVEIRPDAYEFDYAYGDMFDDNWLFVSVELKDGDVERKFRAACMLVLEANQLARWVERLASEPLAAGEDKAIDFLEPHLDLVGRARADGLVDLTLRFEYENDPRTSQPVEVHLTMERPDLASAARDLKAEMLAFPERHGISTP